MENKKLNTITLFLFIISALLFIGFVTMLIIDCTLHYPYGSSPLYLYVVIRFAEFLLPAVICFVIGFLINKKKKE